MTIQDHPSSGFPLEVEKNLMKGGSREQCSRGAGSVGGGESVASGSLPVGGLQGLLEPLQTGLLHVHSDAREPVGAATLRVVLRRTVVQSGDQAGYDRTRTPVFRVLPAGRRVKELRRTAGRSRLLRSQVPLRPGILDSVPEGVYVRILHHDRVRQVVDVPTLPGTAAVLRENQYILRAEGHKIVAVFGASNFNSILGSEGGRKRSHSRGRRMNR